MCIYVPDILIHYYTSVHILQLHEDMNRVKQKPYLERPEGDGTNDTAIAKEAWSKHLQRDNSVITDHIGSLMRSELTCPDCNKVITCLMHLLNIKLYCRMLFTYMHFSHATYVYLTLYVTIYQRSHRCQCVSTINIPYK